MRMLRVVFQRPWFSPVAMAIVAMTLAALYYPSLQEESRIRRAEAVVFARQCLADGRTPSHCYEACKDTPDKTACRSVALAAMEDLRGR